MEKMAHEISSKISSALNYDDNKEAIIAYGLTAIFQVFIIAALISVIGILSRSWIESVIIFIGVGLLKKSTGGAHARTIGYCTFISVFTISLFAVISKYVFSFSMGVFIELSITLVIFLICLYVFYKRVPVDSINKPIKKPEKIKRLRNQSYAILAIYTALACVLTLIDQNSHKLNSIVFSLHFVLLWQAFMLTKSGSKFINRLDLKLYKKEVSE